MARNKITIYIFLTILLFYLSSLFFLSILPKKAQAANNVNFIPQVTVGDFTAKKSKPITSNSIGEYIVSIYKYAIGIVGILAAVVMMFGGVRWIMAGGNASAIGEAKAWIGAALTGLLLALGSWMILNTINPTLVTIQSINPTKPGKIIWCCSQKKGIVSPISKNSNNTMNYSCPTGSIPYNNNLKECKKNKGGYFITNRNMNCCQFKTSFGVMAMYSCISGQNLTENDCRREQRRFESFTLLKNHYCDGHRCKNQ